MIKTPKPTEEADEAETNGADKGIDINQCLKLFTEEEQLREGEEWYCSNCKDHKRLSFYFYGPRKILNKIFRQRN